MPTTTTVTHPDGTVVSVTTTGADAAPVVSAEVSELEGLCVTALNARGHGVKSVRVDPTRMKGGYICGTLRVFVEWNEPAGKPDSVVLKMEEVGSNDHDVALALKLYDREWHFYEVMNAQVNDTIRVPKFYAIVKRGDHPIGVLMENFELCPEPVLCPEMDEPSIMLLIEHVANLHSKFFRKDDELLKLGVRHLNCDWFQPSWQLKVAGHWPDFEKKWTGVLSDEAMAAGKKIINGFQWVQNELSKPPCTFLHGDVKPPNLFFIKDGFKGAKGNVPAFIDWQYTGIGKGVCDIVFFMIEGFTIEYQRGIETPMMKKYHDTLLAKGVTDYSFEDCQRDWKLATMHFPIYVSMWFGTVPDEHLVDPAFPKRFVPRVFDAIMRNGSHLLIPDDA